MEVPRAYNGLALNPRAKNRFCDKNPKYLPTNIIKLHKKKKKEKNYNKNTSKLNISLQLENKIRRYAYCHWRN